MGVVKSKGVLRVIIPLSADSIASGATEKQIRRVIHSRLRHTLRLVVIDLKGLRSKKAVRAVTIPQDNFEPTAILPILCQPRRDWAEGNRRHYFEGRAAFHARKSSIAASLSGSGFR